MSQLQLKRISRDIIDHAEQALVPDRGLPKMIDGLDLNKALESILQRKP